MIFPNHPWFPWGKNAPLFTAREVGHQGRHSGGDSGGNLGGGESRGELRRSGALTDFVGPEARGFEDFVDFLY